jgi:hypothetical protein
MNATVSPKKATDWSGTYQKVNPSKETRRSWYHAIDIKRVQILVKFERRLSIQFGRKKRYKTFSEGMAQPPFLLRMIYFSEMR